MAFSAPRRPSHDDGAPATGAVEGAGTTPPPHHGIGGLKVRAREEAKHNLGVPIIPSTFLLHPLGGVRSPQAKLDQSLGLRDVLARGRRL